MKTVAEVTAIVKKWLDENASTFPDFAGAFLFGGIVHLSQEAYFAAYRDVDLIIVLDRSGKVEETNLELLVEGIMIEVGFMASECFSSPETILADPEVAANFAATNILADPVGNLKLLQTKVQSEFEKRKWVQARCESELKSVWGRIDSITSSETVFKKMNSLWDVLRQLTGLVALAFLKPPTHRRSLVLAKEILEDHQRPDLHAHVLRLWGSADLSRSEVQALLDRAMPVFDRAVAIHKTPVPADFKLTPHLRPYFLEASQEMIDAGCHREATYWIALPALLGSLVLMLDGSEEDQVAADVLAKDFYCSHGIFSPEDVDARVPMARNLAEALVQFTNETIERYSR